MACFKPLTAGRADPKIYGSTRLVFGNAIEAGMQKLKVSCGQCIGCRLDRSLLWATRCVHESKNYENNTFITLTYSDEQAPTDMSLSLSEFQRFAKRLRERLAPKKIKIFHCGEYSPKRPKFIPPGTRHPDTYGEGQRPHYHAIIFNHDFPDKELWSVRNDVRVYSSDSLDDIWGKGFATCGDVTFESAAYVARYTIDKLNGQLAEAEDPITGLKHYERVSPVTGEIHQVKKEYATMSNGIGSDFFNQFHTDMYPRDHVVINGTKTRPPRYYDQLFEKMQPATMEAIKEKRIEEMQKHAKDNTPDRLRAKEAVKQAQLNMLKREAIT